MISSRSILATVLVFGICDAAWAQVSPRADAYDVLLHSRSVTEQRAALLAIMKAPQVYVPRIRKTIRDYPRLVRRDRTAANRAVTLSALLRDRLFAADLAALPGHDEVESECLYACPVVFALTIHAAFGDWSPPRSLDGRLSTVSDLRATVSRIPGIDLRNRPISDFMSGPVVDREISEITGKTEEELIALAGPSTSSYDVRLLAATALEASVSTSANRAELYLLAMNNIRDDASQEYLDAIYEAIYRSELARSRGR